MIWCEACRDHYPASHYADGMHLAGPEYGPLGVWIALTRTLEAERRILAGMEAQMRSESRRVYADSLARVLAAIDMEPDA